MPCEKFDARMHELLDRREPPALDSVLQDHAQGCERCAERLAAQGALLSGLRQIETPALPADFAQRVLAVRQAEPKRGLFGTMTITLVALAAMLLLALLPAWWLLSEAGRGDRETIGGNQGGSIARDQEKQGPAHRPVPPSLAGMKRPAGNGSHHRDTPSAADQPLVPGSTQPQGVVDVDRVASRGGPRGSLLEPYTGLVPTLDDLPWRLSRDMVGVDENQAKTLKAVWVDRVATPLEPVTNSVTAAIDVVRQTLAIGPEEQPEGSADDQPQADRQNREHLEHVA